MSEIVDVSTVTERCCTAVGTIYIITSNLLKSHNLYKIGYSFDFTRDLQVFNTSLPLLYLDIYPVFIADNIKCVKSLERRLHAEFNNVRCMETQSFGWFVLATLDGAKSIVNAHIVRMNKYSTCDCIIPTEKQVYCDMLTLVRNFNINIWMQPQKHSFNDICQQFGLNIETDVPVCAFAHINIADRCVLTEQLFDMLGYNNGRRYRYRKTCILRLLRKNPHIKFTIESYTKLKTDCVNNNSNGGGGGGSNQIINYIYNISKMDQRYIVLTAGNFEKLLQQLTTFKIIELQHLFVLMKCIAMRYFEYVQIHEILF